VDKREWLAQVMTAREYAARQAGESSKKRGERRVLKRWIRAGHRFHPRVYMRIMGRSTQQLTTASQMRPWNPNDRPRRPTGRLHGTREMERSVTQTDSQEQENRQSPDQSRSTTPSHTHQPRNQPKRAKRKRKRTQTNQENEGQRRNNKRRKAPPQRKRKRKGEEESQRSLKHFFPKQCQRK